MPDPVRLLPSRTAIGLAVLALLAGGIGLGLLTDPATGRADRVARARVAVAVAPPPVVTADAPAPDTAPLPEVDAPADAEPEAAPAPDPAPSDAPEPATEPRSQPEPDPEPEEQRTPEPPAPIGHVWLVVLADERYAALFDPAAAPYLAGELRPKGLLLSHLYAIGHESLPNGVALLSGRVTTPVTRGNCPVYGGECLQAPDVPTLPGRLTGAGLTWRAYVESIASPCRHPDPEAPDPWQGMRAGDPYATWRNPFMYFREITEAPECATSVVGLDALAPDLATADATPAFSYVVPDLCHDGRADPCAPGAPSGTAAADAWLRTVLAPILASPAYAADGLVIVTSDQAPASGPGADGSACCDLPRPGGGRVGALLLSPFVEPGAEDARPMSHLTLLRLVEDAFRIDPLGETAESGRARLGARSFPRSQPVHPATTPP